jgi:hypothetical protein
MLHHPASQATVPFNFGPADWTSVIALQPRHNASPMENVLWKKLNDLNTLCFI